jgi:hypothetical protein
LNRTVRVVVVAVVVATMLVAASAPVFARPLRGGLATESAACQLLANGSGTFEWRAGGTVCWVNSPVTEND